MVGIWQDLIVCGIAHHKMRRTANTVSQVLCSLQPCSTFGPHVTPALHLGGHRENADARGNCGNAQLCGSVPFLLQVGRQWQCCWQDTAKPGTAKLTRPALQRRTPHSFPEAMLDARSLLVYARLKHSAIFCRIGTCQCGLPQDPELIARQALDGTNQYRASKAPCQSKSTHAQSVPCLARG